MTPTQRLAELGLVLPETARPVGSYVPAILVGCDVLTSGQIPMVAGRMLHEGVVGDNLGMEEAQACARACALNALSAVASVCGGLDAIRRIVRVCVFVASTPSFTDQPKVANAASDLFAEVFGDAGRHVRSAVGVSALPLNAPVELELVALVDAA